MDTTPLFPLEQYEASFPDLPQAENDDTDAALQERDHTDETPDTEGLRQATEPASPTVFGQEDVPAQDRITTVPVSERNTSRIALKSLRPTRRVQVGWPVIPRTTASWYRLRRRPQYTRPLV